MKIIKVTKCSNCPYLVPEEAYVNKAYCVHKKSKVANTILRVSSIPDWCPLDNK